MKWRYVIAVNLVVLAVAAALILGLSLWVAAAAIAIAALTLAAWYVVDKRAAKKGAAGIEKDLAAQADALVKNIRPDQRAEIEDMRGQFMKELQALKATKLGGGGMRALYTLPWYMIIGPPGAGKSTALRNSGLQFPSRRGAVKGIGGTRNCDWWLTNEAVILDTAGRYATEDEDREEWFAFLDILKRNRKKKPINGLIVAVSITDLGGKGEKAIAELSARVRERLDEVSERLGMQVPIYLMFTKVDLLPGFVETFGTLKKSERGQIWGATFAVDQQGVAAEQLFSEHFDRLLETLHKRMYSRLEEERRPESREKIFQFPQQLAAMRPQVEHFIEAVFATDVYHDPPLMRGVYLSSGTQEGRPIDLLTSSMAEAFGIARRAEVEVQTEAKSYFLGDLFAKVLFADEDLAARSRKGKKIFLLQRAALAGGAGIATLLITTLPVSAFRENARIISSTRAIVQGVAEQRQKHAGSAATPAELEALRQRLRALKDWEAGAPPLAIRFGMFKGDVIYPYLRQFYTQTLQNELLAPLAAADVAEMKTLKQIYGFNSRPSEQEYKRFFDKLKLHLLLTAPHQASEPAIDGKPAIEGKTEAWVIDTIVARWGLALGGSGGAPESVTEGTTDLDEKTRAMMGEHVRFYLELLRENPQIALPRDEAAVKETRNMLGRVSYAEAVIKQVIAEAGTHDRDENIRRVMGGDVTPLASDRQQIVRAAFTKWGWEHVVRERIEQEAAHSDHWVYEANVQAAKDTKRFAAELRSVYFKQYIQEWREFINALRVTQPADIADALRTLVELTRGDEPPMKKLVQAVGENITLKDAPRGLAAAAASAGDGLIDKLKTRLGGAGAAVANEVNKKRRPEDDGLTDAGDLALAFRDLTRLGYVPADAAEKPKQLPLDSYQEQLVGLRDVVKTYIEDPRDASALMQKIIAARTAIAGLLERQDISAAWRPRVEGLLMAPIESVSDNLVAIKAEVGRKWCSNVVTPYLHALKNRYPFENSTEEAPLSDVAAFFAPKTGMLWAFYGSELSGDVPQSGIHFYFDNRMSGMAARAYDKNLPHYLQNAQAATAVLFGAGGPTPKMEFDVRIMTSASFSRIALESGGQVVDYAGGPERVKRLVWPAQDANLGATLRVTGRGGAEDTIHFNGEWGLFRLLEAGAATPRGDHFVVRWYSDKFRDEVTIEIKPASGSARANVFSVRGKQLHLQLDQLTPPTVIAHGSPVCQVGT